MKKYLKILLVFVISFILVGCGNSEDKASDDKEPNGKIVEEEKDKKETKTLNCKLEKEDTANSYKLVTTYELTTEDDLVITNKMKEVITSSKQETLSYFENYLKTTYENMNKNYGGYTYNVTNDGKQVIANTTIDYTKINIEKMMEDDASMKLMVNSDNKVTLAGIKGVYATLGITCDE